jgi:hypothetical protein
VCEYVTSVERERSLQSLAYTISLKAKGVSGESATATRAGLALAGQGDYLEAGKMAKYSTPEIRAEEFDYVGESTCLVSSILSGGGSVRDLEQLADALRLAEDSQASERVDQTILSLLEQKIYRKILAQSRRSL